MNPIHVVPLTGGPRSLRERAPFGAWIAAIAAAVALGLMARRPSFPGGGRGVPRMPAPPPDLGTLLYQLGVGSVTWYALIVAAPVLAFGARRFDTAQVPRRLAAVILIATLFLLVATTSAAQYWLTYHGLENRPGLAQYAPQVLRQNVLPWIVLVGVVAAFEGRRRANRERLERERLRAEVAEQRLLALTAQLHPHFLFNTLQGISTLLHRDPDAADELLAKLGDLLRDLLRHRDRALVALGDELRYARTYLEVAAIRFADRLRFSIEAPDDLLDATVPLFLLQPLVENALGHGIGARLEGGTIAIRASRHGQRLRLEVEDDGAGPPSAKGREGIGLSNTRDRLRASFGDDFSLVMEPGMARGTVVRIEVPLRRERATP